MKSLAKWGDTTPTNGSWMPGFSSMVENFFNADFPTLFDSVVKGTAVPAVNVSQTDTAFNIEMAVPGMKKKDFKLEVDNDVMTISCEKETEKEEKDKKYTRREYSYNAFSRSFVLPKNVKTDTVKAQ